MNHEHHVVLKKYCNHLEQMARRRQTEVQPSSVSRYFCLGFAVDLKPFNCIVDDVGSIGSLDPVLGGRTGELNLHPVNVSIYGLQKSYSFVTFSVAFYR